MNQRATKRSIGPGLAMGFGVGASLGVALHSVAEGVALGAGIGVSFALAMYRGNCKKAPLAEAGILPK